MMGPILFLDAVLGYKSAPQYEISQRLGGRDVYITAEGSGPRFAFSKTDNAGRALLFRTHLAATLAVHFSLCSANSGAHSNVKPSDFAINSRKASQPISYPVH